MIEVVLLYIIRCQNRYSEGYFLPKIEITIYRVSRMFSRSAKTNIIDFYIFIYNVNNVFLDEADCTGAVEAPPPPPTSRHVSERQTYVKSEYALEIL